MATAYPQGDFVFPDSASGRFTGFGGPGTQQVQGQNNPITSNNGNFVGGNFVSGFGQNEGKSGGADIASGQFAGFGGPNTQQVQGQNNPVISDNGQFTVGKFVSGFGPNDVSTSTDNGIDSGKFAGFGKQSQQVEGQNNPITSNNGNFVGGNFVSGFEASTPSPSSTTKPVLTQQFYSCMQQCLTTMEYNPVCGSDGQNYQNAARLTCAQRCGSSE